MQESQDPISPVWSLLLLVLLHCCQEAFPALMPRAQLGRSFVNVKNRDQRATRGWLGL
jgi:hypothetical protein